MSIIVPSGTTPRIVVAASWNAAAATMNGGHWKFTWTPTLASTDASFNGATWFCLLAANDDGGIYVPANTKQIQLFRNGNSTPDLIAPAMTWSALQPITFEFNLAAGANASSVTVTGATTGNGVTNFTMTGTYFTASADLGIGRWPGNTDYNINGTISAIEDFASSVVERSVSAGAVSGVDVKFTPVAPLPWLRYFPSRDNATNEDPPSYFLDGDDSPVWKIKDAELLGPVEGPIKERSVAAGAASGIATVGQRTVMRGVTAGAVSNVAVSGSAPPTIAVGSYNWTSQEYGAGGTPARVTLASVTAGSSLLVWRGGKLSDFATMPTTSVGTFTAVANSQLELTDWSGYGSRLYILRNATAGTSVNIDCNVTAFDEHTVHVMEVLAANTIQFSTVTQQGNTGATSTQSTASVTVVRPCVVTVDWGGAHPVGGGNHVVTCVLNLPGGGTLAMTDIGGHSFDSPNGYVQSRRFVLLVSTPGTYSATVTHAPVQGASLHITGITDAKVASVAVGASTGTASIPRRDVQRSVTASALSSIIVNAIRFAIVQRQVAASATSSATVSYLRDVFRAAGLSATSLISTSGAQVRSRSVATSATSGTAVAFKRDVQRSIVAAAQSAIGVSGVQVRSRSVSVGAASGITIVGQKLGTVERSCSMSAASGVLVFGERDAAGVKERSCGASASSTTSVGHTRVVMRSCTASAASAVDVTSRRVVMRSAGLSAVSAILATGSIAGAGVKTARCGMSATSYTEVRPESRLQNAVYRKSNLGVLDSNRPRPIDLPLTPVQRAAIRRVMLDG